MIKKIIFSILAIFVVMTVSLIVKKSPIDPAAYIPPKKPELKGVLEPNDLLKNAKLLAKGKIYGPEDVAIDKTGRIYGGTQDGRVMRILKDGTVETFADTKGRPLGMQFDKNGNLIVCDAYNGLISIDPEGKITTLATSADGKPFKFTDDLDIAGNGIIYFSDASSKYKQSEYLYDLMEARPHGRLLSYNPKKGKAEVLLKGLYFANGIALSKNEDFVLINETYRYRIIRYWLKGPKKGERDIFIDNLPGFPDNISSNRKGTFWVALFTIRNDLMDRLHPYPTFKSVMSKLPRFLWPKPHPYGFVLSIDEKGNIMQSLHEPTGRHLKEITSVKEIMGFLYMGSLHNDRIGRYKLP